MSEWTSKRVAQRFEECVTVMRALPETYNGGYKSFWPDIQYTPEEIAKQEKKPLVMRPLPDAIDRAEETLGWITLIEHTQLRRLMWLRARRVPWKYIPRETGLTQRTAKRRYSENLGIVVRSLVLDGVPVR